MSKGPKRQPKANAKPKQDSRRWVKGNMHGPRIPAVVCHHVVTEVDGTQVVVMDEPPVLVHPRPGGERSPNRCDACTDILIEAFWLLWNSEGENGPNGTRNRSKS